MLRPTLTLIATLLTLAAGAVHADGLVVDEPYPLTMAQNLARATGRFSDQLTNPAYNESRNRACTLEGEQAICAGDGDPMRVHQDWNNTRGLVYAVNWTNRNNATIAGTLYAPLFLAGAGTPQVRPHSVPTVVFVNGLADAFSHDSYRWASQGLAEEGYIVLNFDPQGAGRSATGDSSNASGLPCPIPGELDPNYPIHGTLDDASYLQPVYQEHCVRYMGDVADALDRFLLTKQNPWSAYVDHARLGIVGHSMGGYTAQMSGNWDPRFAAAISMDAYAVLEATVRPATPTLFIQSEQTTLALRPTAPDPTSAESHPTRATWQAFQHACIDTMFVVLRGSTHFEFQYTPPEVAAMGITASSEGERVAFHYVLAWFDHYLKGASGAPAAKAMAAQAAERLAATAFDGSADRSSIGAGTWDPLTQANRPPMIAGETRRDHLSHIFDSDPSILGCAPEESG